MDMYAQTREVDLACHEDYDASIVQLCKIIESAKQSSLEAIHFDMKYVVSEAKNTEIRKETIKNLKLLAEGQNPKIREAAITVLIKAVFLEIDIGNGVYDFDTLIELAKNQGPLQDPLNDVRILIVEKLSEEINRLIISSDNYENVIKSIDFIKTLVADHGEMIITQGFIEIVTFSSFYYNSIEIRHEDKCPDVMIELARSDNLEISKSTIKGLGRSAYFSKYQHSLINSLSIIIKLSKEDELSEDVRTEIVDELLNVACCSKYEDNRTNALEALKELANNQDPAIITKKSRERLILFSWNAKELKHSRIFLEVLIELAKNPNPAISKPAIVGLRKVTQHLKDKVLINIAIKALQDFDV